MNDKEFLVECSTKDTLTLDDRKRLKEIAEKDNQGCVHCLDGKKTVLKDDTDIYIPVRSIPQIVIEGENRDGASYCVAFKINFCPWCGRKLIKK